MAHNIDIEKAAEKHGTKRWDLLNGKVWMQKLVGDKTTSFIAGAEWAALQPKEAFEDGWISIKTPPEDEENVLVLSDRMNGYQYNIYMGWISLKQWYVLSDDGIIKDYNNNADHCTITHWQPLPLPPKK